MHGEKHGPMTTKRPPDCWRLVSRAGWSRSEEPATVFWLLLVPVRVPIEQRNEAKVGEPQRKQKASNCLGSLEFLLQIGIFDRRLGPPGCLVTVRDFDPNCLGFRTLRDRDVKDAVLVRGLDRVVTYVARKPEARWMWP